MDQRTDAWGGDAKWPHSLDEVRQFLDTWYFSVSEVGQLYVRPRNDSVGWNEFCFFLRRLNLLREYGYPPLTTFDFGNVHIPRIDRIRIAEALLDFAQSIGATAVVRPSGSAGGNMILIAMPHDGPVSQAKTQPALEPEFTHALAAVRESA